MWMKRGHFRKLLSGSRFTTIPTQNMVFRVTYYLELHNAIMFYYIYISFLPTKVELVFGTL